MKKVYHLVMIEKTFTLKNPDAGKRKIMSDTLWLDLDKATERARSMVHNEYLNDSFESSIHRYEIESITKDKLMDGIIFMTANNGCNHEDLLSTEFITKSIFFIREKSLLLRLLSNLCEKVNPGYLNGKEFIEGS